MGSRAVSDPACAGVIRQQHGLISRKQAVGAGLSLQQVRYRVQQGVWLPVDHGVFRHHLIPSSWHALVLAPCLSTGAIASHRTAAALWNLDGFHRGVREVTLPSHASPLRPGTRLHRSTTFDQCQATMRHGVPTTGIDRTLIDLAKVVPFVKLRQAIDDARLKGLVDWGDIARCFLGHARRGRDGTAKMRAYLDEHLGEANLPLSTWSRLVADSLVEAGLPMPEFEWEVSGPGFRFKIDLAYPDLRLGLELDSLTWHLNRRSFQQDRERANRLENAGWSMRYFTYQDFAERRAAMIDTVRQARARRSAEIAA